MLLRILLLLIATTTLACAASIEAPASAKAGAPLAVKISGSTNPRDFVTIVSKDTGEGGYDAYVYVDKPNVQLATPATAGDYELRLLGAASPYPTLARRALKVEAVTATLDAPAQVAAGSQFQVRWTGPANARDYIAIASLAPDASPYLVYAYTNAGNPVSLTAPDTGATYELRYFLGAGDKIIGTRRITVGSVSATVTVPAQVAAGANIAVKWQGPNNPRDFVTVVKVGTPDKQYNRYVYTSEGNPLQLRAPDEPGDYEVRYLTAQTFATLGSAKIKVGATSASLQAPAEAVAGSTFDVKWQGPNNAGDFVNLVPKGAREGETGSWAYTARGPTVSMRAPLNAGDYELRYSTGQSNTTVTRVPIRITPGKQEPGFVTVSAGAATTANAVEIILDASGSMLQRIGGQRRIDIAKQTLTRLTSTTLPAGTPFALRVFGRELDSCQTDLEIPLGPLNAGAVAAKIGALEAKNNAKTPIGDSLDKVAGDLSAAKGERLVVLLTDGEETCGGDPAKSIQKLKQAGVSVRVNIVGFAIDDAALAGTFRRWADAGSGTYFDAKDAAGLSNALTQSMRAAFEVVNAQGQVVADGVVGGEKVRVMPGSYSVRVKGTKSGKAVTVTSKETAAVTL